MTHWRKSLFRSVETQRIWEDPVGPCSSSFTSRISSQLPTLLINCETKSTTQVLLKTERDHNRKELISFHRPLKYFYRNFFIRLHGFTSLIKPWLIQASYLCPHLLNLLNQIYNLMFMFPWNHLYHGKYKRVDLSLVVLPWTWGKF